MPANALIQPRVEPEIKASAVEVLGAIGLTVSDAVPILLTRIANEGALPFAFQSDSDDYEAWFGAKVQEAIADERPDVNNSDVEAEFTARRAATLARSSAA